jgi:hypothetical protein
MAGSPIPVSESELIPWLVNFGPKFANYAVTLGFDVPEVEQTQNEVDYLVYLLNVRVPAERQTLAATIEFKNFMKEGDAAASLPATLPGSVPPPAYPAAVPAGILTRLRKLVQNIKSRPGYTETIGQDLGIVSATSYPVEEFPTLTVQKTTAGQVSLGWNKSGWTGVRFQSRQNGGAWIDLGIDLFSPFVDTRPLATPGQPETREYRACYLDGEVPLTYSPAVELAVLP